MTLYIFLNLGQQKKKTLLNLSSPPLQTMAAIQLQSSASAVFLNLQI